MKRFLSLFSPFFKSGRYSSLMVWGLILLGASVMTGCSLIGRGKKTVSFDQLTQPQQSFLVYEVYEMLRSDTGTLPSRNVDVREVSSVGVVIRQNGKFLGEGWSTFSGSLMGSLQGAGFAAKAAVPDFSKTENYQIHLYLLGPASSLNAGYIHGVHALTLRTGKERVVVRNTLAIERNYTEEKLEEWVCEQIDRETPCFRDVDVLVEYHPVAHFGMTRRSDEIVSRYRGKRTTDEYPPMPQLIDTMTHEAEKRLLNNINEDGSFVYVYNPSNGTYSENNNMIRQLMASRLLAEMASENDRLIELHHKNITHVMEHWYQETDEGLGYVYFDDKSKLGAIAMLLRTLLYSPFEEHYADEIEALFQTILALQKPTGEFHARFIAPEYEYDEDYLLTFYSGEAIVALVEMFEFLDDIRALDAAKLSQKFYLERYVEQRGKRYYPAYVPRHTISLNKLYAITHDRRYAEGLFTLNDKLISEMLDVSEAEPFDTRGRFYNPRYPEYGTPHSASDSVYLEGVAYAYEIAELLGDTERMQTYADALELAVKNLYQLQYFPEDTYFLQYPERVIGAVRYRADDNRIRIDTTQHTIDALRKLQALGFR